MRDCGSKRTGWHVWVGACLLLSGCGTQEYDLLIEHRLKEYRHAEKFQVLINTPVDLPGTPIQLRVPGITADESQRFRLLTEKSRDPEYPTDPPVLVSPYRLNPPFLKIPGLRATLEAPLAGANGDTVPAYCYLAAIDKKQKDAEVPVAQIPKLIVDSLKRAFPDQNPTWRDEQCDTPEIGKGVTWKRLSVTGKQPWAYRGRDAGDNAEETPHIHVHTGSFEVWLNDNHPDWLVLVAWRVSNVNSQLFDLNQFATLTAGTLNIRAVDAPAEGG